jgi:YfiH family protein
MFIFNNSTYCFESDTIPFSHGFGTKKTGNALNKSDVETLLSNKSTYIAYCNQYHSTKVLNVQKEKLCPGLNAVGEGDALVTHDLDISLYVKTADCVPIIFVGENEVAISHQGWKGSVNRMIEHVLDAFTLHKVSEIKLLIGPSIGKCCYNITQDQALVYKEHFPEFRDEILEYRDNMIYVDLKKLNYLQAVSLGIRKEHIDVCDVCTKCREDLFFSYRRDRSYGQVSHMISFITHI